MLGKASNSIASTREDAQEEEESEVARKKAGDSSEC